MVVLTKLERRDFDKILSNYGIGIYKKSKHIFVPSNTIYLLETTKGKFILKFFEGADKDFINFQLDIMDFLNKRDVPVQRVVRTNNKDRLFNYKKKRLVIFNYVEGDHPKKMNIALLKDIAKNIGLLHKHLSKLKLKGGDELSVDHQFKSRRGIKKSFMDFKLKDEYDKLIKETKANVDQKKLKRSIVHSDLQYNNLLVKDNKLIAFLDWDDSHWDYLVYDITVFLIDSLVCKTIDLEGAKFFLKVYQKHVKLNDNDKKAIYYFTKNRLLGVINFCIKQLKIHKDIAFEYTETIKKFIKAYKTMMSLEEFLELF